MHIFCSNALIFMTLDTIDILAKFFLISAKME